MRRRLYRFRKAVYVAFPLVVFLFFTIGAYQQYNKEKEKTEKLKVKVEKKTDSTAAQEEGSGPADTVKIGAYILSVYDLDFPGNKVNVDFYLWYNTQKDSLDLLQYLEIMNASESSKSMETEEKRGNIVYQTVRVNSQIKQNWNIANFPFDRQTVEIMIEDYDKDKTRLVFIPDTTGSKFDKDIKIQGWVVKDFGIKVVDNTYETNYGDPAIPLNEYSTYSRTIISFTMERDGKGLFFKLFIGLFISVLMSMLTFFINPLDLDPRFGLPVGAIFASIASQYVIASTLPQNTMLTLVDILHDISFIYIFLCIFLSTLSLRYIKQDKKESSKKLDRISFIVLAVSYVILVSFFVLRAIN